LIFLLDNSRRHDEDAQLPHEKQVEDVHDCLDHAFATGKNLFSSLFSFIIYFLLLAFYKNCLLDLTTNSSDVEYALNNIYQEHCEDIDLTPFVKAMCSHLSPDNQK